jgi:site-specific DNA-methyltransferase (adenine-specific)
MWDRRPVGTPASRFLDAYDVLIRWNDAVSVLDKVTARKEPTLDLRVSSRKPFGLPTNFHGQASDAGLKDPVKLFGSQKVSWVRRSEIAVNPRWVDDWKVLMTAVQGTSAAVETKFLSKPIIAAPGTACSETYLVAGRFGTEQEAARYAAYLRTRFVRFLVSLRKQTQHATRDVYSFVPDLSMDEDWTDAKLYKRYGLTKDEIAFIESQVAEHDDAPGGNASEDADE